MMKVSRFCLRSVLRRFSCLLMAFLTIFVSTSIESNAAKGDLWYVTYPDKNYNFYAPQDDIYESSTSIGTSYKSAFYPLRQFSSATTNHLKAGNTYRVIFSGYCNFVNQTSGPVKTCQVYFLAGGQKFLIGSYENHANYSDCYFEFDFTGGQIGFLFEYSFVTSNANVETDVPYLSIRNITYGGKTGVFFLEDLGSSSAHGDLLQNINETTTHTEEIMDEVNDTSKGILGSIKEFFGSFFDNLVNSVVGLFVPTKEELASIFQQFDDFFAEKFGFLYYPIDVLTDFVSLVTTQTGEAKITLPGFSIMGHQVWSDKTYHVGRVTLFQELCGYVQIVTGTSIVFMFLSYLDRKFNLITRG